MVTVITTQRHCQALLDPAISSLLRCFPNFITPNNQQDITMLFPKLHHTQQSTGHFVKHRFLDPTPREYDSVRSWVGPIVCFPTKFPGGADATGPETMLCMKSTKCKSLSRHSSLCNPRSVARQAPLSMEFSRQEYWSGLLFPSPEDLPDPGITPGLLHCRQILYRLNHQGITWDYI